MAFTKLISSNKDLSWVLEKNPETGIVTKSCRQGFLFGFFPFVNNNTITNEYCIYFKDASDEMSYKPHPDASFEYLNASKYNSARFINDSIEEMLRSARENVHTYLNEGKDYDLPAFHTMFFNAVETQYKTIDIFQRYFKDKVSIQGEEITKNNYKITFKNEEPLTLSIFLSIINLFGIFAVLNSNDYTYLTDDMIKKYLRILNKIDVPYFIRYLFKVRLLRNPRRFEELVKDLSTTKLYNSLELTYGDTHDARIDWIKNGIDLNHSIIDIGTGIDYKYLKIFAPLLQQKGLKYYAIEQNLDARERIKAGCKNRGLDNVEIYETFDSFLEIYENDSNKYLILCTEVLEHNELDEVESLLLKVLSKIKLHKFFITVPNHDFNKFYGFTNTEKRHEDHKWEISEKEFIGFIDRILSPSQLINPLKTKYSFNNYQIGDKIDGVGVSTAIIIE